MMIAVVPVLFAILGALIYALAGNTKLVEIGRLTFLASMIALMLALAQHTVKLG